MNQSIHGGIFHFSQQCLARKGACEGGGGGCRSWMFTMNRSASMGTYGEQIVTENRTCCPEQGAILCLIPPVIALLSEAILSFRRLLAP